MAFTNFVLGISAVVLVHTCSFLLEMLPASCCSGAFSWVEDLMVARVPIIIFSTDAPLSGQEAVVYPLAASAAASIGPW